MKNVERIRGVFNGPPPEFITSMTTGAALLGNGDLCVAVGGASDQLAFRLSKVDFWQARDGAGRPNRAKARAIGTLALHVPGLKDSSYLLEQRIHDATIHGHFDKGGTELAVSAWTPRGLNCLVVELCAGGTETVTIRPVFEIQDGNESITEHGQLGEIDWYERRFEEPNLFWRTGVTVAMKAVGEEGISLGPGQRHTLVLAVVTNHDAAGHRDAAMAMAAAMDVAKLADARRGHLDWWTALWAKCAKIEIGDLYLEDRYYGSHYVIAACSGNRTFPPGLFGWVTGDNPAWGSDYHANYNFEAPWWGVLTSNLVELAEPYDQPILDYLPRMKAYAKRFLHVRGAYCNVGFGPRGLHVDRSETPYDDGLNFLGQKSNASFLAVNMIMRYYLTLDLEYARRCVYPYIVEVMNFWEDYLVFEQGRYVTPDDCVNECEFFHMLPPDHRDFERAKDRNSPLSLGLIRMVSRAALDLSTALGADEGRRVKWRHILDHISDFSLTERNGKTMFDVCENGLTTLDEVNMCCIQHIYPAGAVSLSSDPALVRAGADTILYKDLWEQDNSFSTVFAAAARVGVSPDLILRKMKEATAKFVQPNFLLQMGGGGIENCSGIPAGLNEMLMQSHEGFIRLFPCWPEGRSARFEGLRACGAFLVSAARDGVAVVDASITSERGAPCRVLNCWGKRKVSCRADGVAVPLWGDGTLEFETEAGRTYRLVCEE